MWRLRASRRSCCRSLWTRRMRQPSNTSACSGSIASASLGPGRGSRRAAPRRDPRPRYTPRDGCSPLRVGPEPVRRAACRGDRGLGLRGQQPACHPRPLPGDVRRGAGALGDDPRGSLRVRAPGRPRGSRGPIVQRLTTAAGRPRRRRSRSRRCRGRVRRGGGRGGRAAADGARSRGSRPYRARAPRDRAVATRARDPEPREHLAVPRAWRHVARRRPGPALAANRAPDADRRGPGGGACAPRAGDPRRPRAGAVERDLSGRVHRPRLRHRPADGPDRAALPARAAPAGARRRPQLHRAVAAAGPGRARSRRVHHGHGGHAGRTLRDAHVDGPRSTGRRAVGGRPDGRAARRPGGTAECPEARGRCERGDRDRARRRRMGRGGQRRRSRLRHRGGGGQGPPQLRAPVHAGAGRADRRAVRGAFTAGGGHSRPAGDPGAAKGERMTEYNGPERRRGGANDRRNQSFERVKILIVDDHALFRVGIRQILEREPDLEVVAEADDARTALDAAFATNPDVILMDLSLPAPGGIETTQRIRRELPATAIVVLSTDEDEEALFDAIKAGAAAFILKDIAPEDLVMIIRRVATGEFLINDKVFSKPAVASRVLKEFRELAVYGQEAAPIFAPLSPREVEILDNIAQGMTNKQVAYALSISEQTVKNHMSSILRKLSVNDRTQAVVYAMRQGWIRMPED